jgi:hypothetical protein
MGTIAGLVFVLTRLQSARHGSGSFPAELGLATLTGLLAGVVAWATMKCSLLFQQRRNV